MRIQIRSLSAVHNRGVVHRNIALTSFRFCGKRFKRLCLVGKYSNNIFYLININSIYFSLVDFRFHRRIWKCTFEN